MIKLKVKKNRSGLKLKEMRKIFYQYFPNYDLTTQLQVFALDDNDFTLTGCIKDLKPELLARFNKIEHLDPICKECEIVSFRFNNEYHKTWKPHEFATWTKYFEPDLGMIARNIQDGCVIGNETVATREKCFSDCNCDCETFNNKLNEFAITTLHTLETVVKVLFDEQLEKMLVKIKELKQQKDDLVKKTVASLKAQFDLNEDF